MIDIGLPGYRIPDDRASIVIFPRSKTKWEIYLQTSLSPVQDPCINVLSCIHHMMVFLQHCIEFNEWIIDFYIKTLYLNVLLRRRLHKGQEFWASIREDTWLCNLLRHTTTQNLSPNLTSYTILSAIVHLTNWALGAFIHALLEAQWWERPKVCRPQGLFCALGLALNCGLTILSRHKTWSHWAHFECFWTLTPQSSDASTMLWLFFQQITPRCSKVWHQFFMFLVWWWPNH